MCPHEKKGRTDLDQREDKETEDKDTHQFPEKDFGILVSNPLTANYSISRTFVQKVFSIHPKIMDVLNSCLDVLQPAVELQVAFCQRGGDPAENSIHLRRPMHQNVTKVSQFCCIITARGR